MSDKVTSFIGIGSNLKDPLQQVLHATTALAALPETEIRQCSSCYQSAPMGPADQPDFINRVVSVDTTLLPHQLLSALQMIEQQQGRERSRRWGERVIDLDILLYGNEMIDTPDLMIPHEGMKERAFVLYPLLEIAPDLVLPSGEKASVLQSNCCADHITLIVEDVS